MKLQVDDIEGVQRLSVGEFNEAFPKSSRLVDVLTYLVDAGNGWDSARCVLVGHWVEEPSTSGWRVVASFPYRHSLLKTSAIQLSEVPDRTALAHAISCGWRLPRLILCIVDRADEHRLGSVQSSDWKRSIEEEVPSTLLSLRMPLLVLAFYHQRWISAYLPKPTASGLPRDLLNAFRDELVPVSDEL